jgi:carbonic anhydrase/acetyltransferase-like protein (isoleucine patch superfamily)
MPVLKYKGVEPTIDESAWVSPDATLIGDVEVKANSVIWSGSYLRAEMAPIYVGQYSTIFDGVMMVTRNDKSSISIGNYNIIETGTAIFGTTMEDYVTVNQNCVLYESSSVGEGVVILPESVVPSGMIIAERSIMKGDPVSTVREQTRNDVMKTKERAEHFTEMFVRMRKRLPNLQGYAMTEADLMRILIDAVRENDVKPKTSEEQPSE